jgi:hypothetical protein
MDQRLRRREICLLPPEVLVQARLAVASPVTATCRQSFGNRLASSPWIRSSCVHSWKAQNGSCTVQTFASSRRRGRRTGSAKITSSTDARAVESEVQAKSRRGLSSIGDDGRPAWARPPPFLSADAPLIGQRRHVRPLPSRIVILPRLFTVNGPALRETDTPLLERFNLVFLPSFFVRRKIIPNDLPFYEVRHALTPVTCTRQKRLCDRSTFRDDWPKRTTCHRHIGLWRRSHSAGLALGSLLVELPQLDPQLLAGRLSAGLPACQRPLCQQQPCQQLPCLQLPCLQLLCPQQPYQLPPCLPRLYPKLASEPRPVWTRTRISTPDADRFPWCI